MFFFLWNSMVCQVPAASCFFRCHGTGTISLQGLQEISIEGGRRGRSLIRANVSFGQPEGLQLANLGLSRSIKFRQIRDYPCPSPPAPIPWSPNREFVQACQLEGLRGKLRKSKKILERGGGEGGPRGLEPAVCQPRRILGRL